MVSIVVRLSTAGSASTWPKSGSTVACSVAERPTGAFRSAPSRTPTARRAPRGGARGAERRVVRDDRQQLEPAVQQDAVDPDQRSEARRPAGGVAGDQLP